VPNIGPLELVIVLIILLVVFGPKRLPGLGRSLGTSMREFKDSISGSSKDDDDVEGNRAALSAGAGATVAEGATPAEPIPASAPERDAAPTQVSTEPRA
jgi:sec-independent protein translocase protein TatA